MQCTRRISGVWGASQRCWCKWSLKMQVAWQQWQWCPLWITAKSPLLSIFGLDLWGMDDNAWAIRWQLLQKLFHYITLFVSVLVTGATSLLLSDFPWKWLEYHTSILTGEGWVRELLVGHPKCIWCELGVHSHVFFELIEELHWLGHGRSKYVSLEEQLAIFLYISVTRMTIRHVREQFQQSNKTISWWVICFVLITAI